MQNYKQFILGVRLRDDATFGNFIAGLNKAALNNLQTTLAQKSPSFTYLWGPSGAGRSHLLQACCHRAQELNLSSIFLPISNNHIQPPILFDLEHINVVGIDDIHLALGNPLWEEALFNFYNRIQMKGNHLLVTGDKAPNTLNCLLPDLGSRLASGLTFMLQALNDEEKLLALQQKAAYRGFTLSSDVGLFLIHHFSREMNILADIFDQLDQASLAEKRRLTIPFVKQVLGLTPQN